MASRCAPAVLVLLLVALQAPRAEASYLSASNQRIDRALYHAHGPREVLACRIEAIHERQDGIPGDFPFHRDLDVRVQGVVLGDAQRKGRLLKLTTTHFEWPVHLVPYEVGARFLLVHDPEARGEDGRARPLVVVPTRRDDPPAVRTRAEAMRVSRPIHPDGARGCARCRPPPRPDPADRAPCWTGEMRSGYCPSSTRTTSGCAAPPSWSSRFASGESAHVAAAAEDLRAFLRSTKVRDMIPAASLPMGTAGHSYAPYPLLFDHYFYLVTDWSEDERARLRPVVALARVVATELDDDEWTRWRHGVACLAYAGTAEDADLLHACLQRVLADGDHPLHGNVRVRVTLIDGLSRVLGIENQARLTLRGAGMPPGPSETIDGEAAQLERIREALESR